MSTSIFYCYKFYLKSEKHLKNNQNNQKINQKCPQICDVWKVFEQMDRLIGSMDKRQNCGVSVANYGNCFFIFKVCPAQYLFWKIIKFFLELLWTFLFFYGLMCREKLKSSFIRRIKMTENRKFINWRTAQQACDLIKEQDENTGITRFYIVKLANNEKIRSLKSGRKLLVDFDSLIAFLQGTDYEYESKQIRI